MEAANFCMGWVNWTTDGQSPGVLSLHGDGHLGMCRKHKSTAGVSNQSCIGYCSGSDLDVVIAQLTCISRDIDPFSTHPQLSWLFVEMSQNLMSTQLSTIFKRMTKWGQKLAWFCQIPVETDWQNYQWIFMVYHFQFSESTPYSWVAPILDCSYFPRTLTSNSGFDHISFILRGYLSFCYFLMWIIMGGKNGQWCVMFATSRDGHHGRG